MDQCSNKVNVPVCCGKEAELKYEAPDLPIYVPTLTDGYELPI